MIHQHTRIFPFGKFSEFTFRGRARQEKRLSIDLDPKRHGIFKQKKFYFPKRTPYRFWNRVVSLLKKILKLALVLIPKRHRSSPKILRLNFFVRFVDRNSIDFF